MASPADEAAGARREIQRDAAISSGAPMRFINASPMTWRDPCSSIALVIIHERDIQRCFSRFPR
jgi:hypothetical protein